MSMTLEELLALLPDNTTGQIGADDVRTVTTELYNLPGGADLGDLHGALLATKVWSTGSSAYVWPGDGTEPDTDSYTSIVYVDPTGAHDPTSSPGGRSVLNDLWEAGDPSGGAGTGLLAFKAYSPGTQVNAVTTSTTYADIDATNLAVTFIAPASGNVIVSLTAVGTVPTSTTLGWAVRSGGTVVAGSGCGLMHVTSGSLAQRTTHRFVVTGLSPAVSYTYTFAHARVYGGGTNCGTNYGGAADEAGPAVIEIWGA